MELTFLNVEVKKIKEFLAYKIFKKFVKIMNDNKIKLKHITV